MGNRIMTSLWELVLFKEGFRENLKHAGLLEKIKDNKKEVYVDWAFRVQKDNVAYPARGTCQAGSCGQ